MKRPTKSQSACRTRSPKGSTLVFAIVLLGLLAMLGISFLLFMRQSRQISRNVMDSNGASQVVEAGLNHAMRALYKMVNDHQIVSINQADLTLNAEFNGTDPATFKTTAAQYWTNAVPNAPYVNPYWQFGTGDYSPAPLPPRRANPVLCGDSPAVASFTVSPLSAATTVSSEWAEWKDVQGWPNEFYANATINAGASIGERIVKNNSPVFERPRAASVIGQYAVWIHDLDSGFYAIPFAVNPTQPNPDATDWNLEPAVTGTAETTARNILVQLSTLMPPQQNPPLPRDPNDPNRLTDADIGFIVAPPAQPYKTLSEFSLDLRPTSPYDAASYPDFRNNLQYFLTPHMDDEGVVKGHPAAININTAPVEVLEAALSQIPAYPSGTFSTKMMSDGVTSLARRIAARIVEKRPFLCRMDFEDFAAAQLHGDISKQDSPVGAINFAILYRSKLAFNYTAAWDPANWADAADLIELPLHQYLEIPGRVGAPSSYQAYAPMLHSRMMQRRFQYFYANPGLETERLEISEFNNFLNSVTTGRFGDSQKQTQPTTNDRQVAPSGQVYSNGDQGVVVIHPGPDYLLQTQPHGGNVLGEIIVSGWDSGTQQWRLRSVPDPNDRLVVQASSPCIVSSTGTAPATIPLPGSDDELLDLTGSIGIKIISPGPDEVLQTVPSPGDIVVMRDNSYIRPGIAGTLTTSAASPDVRVQAILSGPITAPYTAPRASTSIFGYSYYSHDTVSPDYKPARSLAQSNPPKDPKDCVNPAIAGKFVYYGDQAAGYEPAVTSVKNKNYLLPDLKRWSCVGNGDRNAYYDFWFNSSDIMLADLGTQPPNPPNVDPNSDPPPDPTTFPVVQAIDSTVDTVDPTKMTPGSQPLRTRQNDKSGDDVQENAKGTQNLTWDDVIISPGPDGVLQTSAAPEDLVVDAIRVPTTFSPVWPDPASIDFAFSSDPSYDYYVPDQNLGFSQLTEPNTQYATQIGLLITKLIMPKIVAPATSGIAFSSTADDVPDVANNKILAGSNKACDTFVWGPLRACQNPPDKALLNADGSLRNADQIPFATTDVSWSPQFAFRSRFFGIYVLGISQTRGSASPETPDAYGGDVPADSQWAAIPSAATPPTFDRRIWVERMAVRGYKPTTLDPALKTVPPNEWPTVPIWVPMPSPATERRIEAVYDALKDKIIWQRSPVSAKHSLAEP